MTSLQNTMRTRRRSRSARCGTNTYQCPSAHAWAATYIRTPDNSPSPSAPTQPTKPPDGQEHKLPRKNASKLTNGETPPFFVARSPRPRRPVPDRPVPCPRCSAASAGCRPVGTGTAGVVPRHARHDGLAKRLPFTSMMLDIAACLALFPPVHSRRRSAPPQPQPSAHGSSFPQTARWRPPVVVPLPRPGQTGISRPRKGEPRKEHGVMRMTSRDLS